MAIAKSWIVLASLTLFACTKTDTAPVAGVDMAKKTIYVGALNDESGPGATIGKPFAAGKRILAAHVNAGGSGILPDGWKIEMVERDHGYNPQNAVQKYNELKDQVLYIATSFGTPNTLPLRPMLAQDKVVAFPASLSSKMAEDEHTPPLGPSYKIEAMRAMDAVVEMAGGADKVKAGIVYQQDDYGADGLDGWKEAAKHHNVTIVAEQAIAPGQKDFTAAITALNTAGATHVLLTTLPSATGPILGTAAQLKFMPTWIANTPAWIDRFFDAAVIPPAVFANFYWVNGLPFWGEEVPGMKEFMAAYDKFGKDKGAPDFYMLTSYVQGLAQLEIVKRAIEGNALSRESFMTAMHNLKQWNAGGMIQPLDLSTVPYVTGTKTRVLKPDMANKSWTVAHAYAEPASMKPGQALARP